MNVLDELLAKIADLERQVRALQRAENGTQFVQLAGRSTGQRVSGIASTGYTLEVYRDLAAASTNSAVLGVTQDNASDDQPAARVQQDGSGDILLLLDGATEVLVVEDGGKTVLRRGAAGQLLDIGTLSMSESATTYVSGFYAFAADNVKFHLVGNAAGASILGGGVDGDTNRRLIIYADGKYEMGSGAANRDTNLYRNAANELKTDDSMIVATNLGVGISSAPSGKAHVDQSSTTAAIPVLILDQADLDQPMIEFVTTIGTGNAIEAKGAKSLTTTHFIMVKLPGGLTRYIEAGTSA